MHPVTKDAEFFEIIDDRTRPSHSDDISRIIYRAEHHGKAMTSKPFFGFILLQGGTCLVESETVQIFLRHSASLPNPAKDALEAIS